MRDTSNRENGALKFVKFRSNVGEPRRRRGGRNRPSQGTLFSPASAEAPPLFSSGINGPTRSVLLRFEKSLALKKKHSKQYSVRIRRQVTYFRSLQKELRTTLDQSNQILRTLHRTKLQIRLWWPTQDIVIYERFMLLVRTRTIEKAGSIIPWAPKHHTGPHQISGL